MDVSAAARGTLLTRFTVHRSPFTLLPDDRTHGRHLPGLRSDRLRQLLQRMRGEPARPSLPALPG